MALDEFKTQVLLLHSEETTLEQLSSGFGDKYTVHRATSGSEALNTLVDTPIDIMVTAQNLPGMSGLDALREAKKRSPDTLGILIAGNADAGLEALVGDEEVFQVVRGVVTADALLLLVENATQQMRLNTLSQSANDTTANVDRPVTEHIIMETSENGSAIISDGTGRMPALDPEKVSAAASVGARAVDVLVLTKDEEFLETIKNSSRGMHKVHYAATLPQADDAISKFKIGVAVIDAAMVGDRVEQLTQHLRRGVPRLVAIVAGRRVDGDMLMDLINRGRVYRFLLKPVSPGRARLAVEASVKHHLEAPNVAFGSKGKAAAKSAPKASRAKAAPKVAPKAATKAAPKAARHAPAPRVSNPIDPPLGSALGEDSARLVKSVSGMIGSVGEKISRGRDALSEVQAQASMQSAAFAADSDGSLWKSPKLLGTGAAAIVIIAGALFWYMSGPGETPPPQETQRPTPAFTESAVKPSSPPPVEVAVDVDALLKEARSARDSGQIVNPVGRNAIDLFYAASQDAPGNEIVGAEFDAVIAQALGMAESALLESRLDDADITLQRVAGADADNPRLPFLTAQVTQVRLRGYLDQARIAIRENRFEDAAVALSAAHGLITPDDTEINAVADELSAARSAQQVDDVLERANARLEGGDLLSPSNDNARYYYELVLSADPDNIAARQGLNVIASKLVLQTRAEVDNGNINAAEDLLAAARAIDPTNSELTATTVAVSKSRAELAAQQRRIEAESQATAEPAEPAATPAEPLAITDDAPGLSASDVGTRMIDVTATSAVAGPDADTTSGNPVNAEDTAIDVRNMKPVGVSTLTRTKYAAPKFPRLAERRNLSGWVDVTFTVTIDGTVKDVEVPKSEPGDVFVDSAMRAVEKWEFEPIVENGTFVEKRAGVRLMFAFE